MARVVDCFPSSDDELPDLDALLRKPIDKKVAATPARPQPSRRDLVPKSTAKPSIRRIRRLDAGSQLSNNQLLQRYNPEDDPTTHESPSKRGRSIMKGHSTVEQPPLERRPQSPTPQMIPSRSRRHRLATSVLDESDEDHTLGLPLANISRVGPLRLQSLKTPSRSRLVDQGEVFASDASKDLFLNGANAKSISSKPVASGRGSKLAATSGREQSLDSIYADDSSSFRSDGSEVGNELEIRPSSRKTNMDIDSIPQIKIRPALQPRHSDLCNREMIRSPGKKSTQSKSPLVSKIPEQDELEVMAENITENVLLPTGTVLDENDPSESSQNGGSLCEVSQLDSPQDAGSLVDNSQASRVQHEHPDFDGSREESSQNESLQNTSLQNDSSLHDSSLHENCERPSLEESSDSSLLVQELLNLQLQGDESFEKADTAATPASESKTPESDMKVPTTPSKTTSSLASTVPSVRIPETPHRPSTDAFWNQEVVDGWNDQHSPRKPVLLSPVKSPSKLVLSKLSPSKEARKVFEGRKHTLAWEFFQDLDSQITQGQIAELSKSTGGVQLVWSKTLNTTAGRANWRRETIRTTLADGTQKSVEYKHHASIELAEKVIDDENRLLNVVAHEFCHLANFMVNGITNNPHGKEFKAWATKCTRAFSKRGIKVTTKHTYEIDFKYIWECSCCGHAYKRHSKSIDPQRHRCSKCKSALRQIKPAPRNGGKPSEYQTFVKEQMKVVREAHPGSSQRDIMRIIAEKWSARRQAGSSGTVAVATQIETELVVQVRELSLESTA